METRKIKTGRREPRRVVFSARFARNSLFMQRLRVQIVVRPRVGTSRADWAQQPNIWPSTETLSFRLLIL